MPVKAKSTSSWSVSSITQRAILAMSPLACRSDEPRPRITTPVVLGSGMSSACIAPLRRRLTIVKIWSQAVRCGAYKNCTCANFSRAASMACGISILTWPAAFKINGTTITRFELMAARRKPSLMVISENSIKQISMRQVGWRTRHCWANASISSLPDFSREPWPTKRMVSAVMLFPLYRVSCKVKKPVRRLH